MPTPTDILREEHRVILRALDVLESAADHLQRGAALPEGLWRRLIGWFRSFADRSHHAKEERHLFPAMGEAGIPREGGPIGVMLDEHEEGRVLIAIMESGTPAARAEAARNYVGLLRGHVEKENGVLFPMADMVLDPSRQEAMEQEFGVMRGEAPDAPSAEAELDRMAALL